MVSETSVLVKCQDEQSFFPLWGVADSLVDSFDEVFAKSDWGRRVERLIRAALGVEVGELRERASLGVSVEFVQGSNIRLVCSGSQSPVVESSIWVEANRWKGISDSVGGGVLVIHPRNVVL